MSTAARLQYGCTWINTHFMLANEMPHGGLKQSGYGKDMSLYALEDYTAVRHVMINHGQAEAIRSSAWRCSSIEEYGVVAVVGGAFAHVGAA